MANSLTRTKWTALRDTLLRVPTRSRNIGWKEALDLVEHILAGRNNLTPDLNLESGRFAVECETCHKAIEVMDDFVRHAISNKFVHYDCHHKTTTSLKDLV